LTGLTKFLGPVGTAISVINNLSSLIGVIEQCWDDINLANGIVIFSVFAFLSAEISISISNPFLGIFIAGLELSGWNILLQETIDGICPV
jgi:hypothetical protein